MADNNIEITKLANGMSDPIQMLFADLPTPPKVDNFRNPHQIIFKNNEKSNKSKKSKYQKEIKTIIPEGLRRPMSIDTNKQARLCLTTDNSPCGVSYKMSPQAMLTKIPGYFFTGYQSA